MISGGIPIGQFMTSLALETDRIGNEIISFYLLNLIHRINPMLLAIFLRKTRNSFFPCERLPSGREKPVITMIFTISAHELSKRRNLL
jgi:hypothetical protein